MESILRWFGLASELKLQFYKSKVVGVWCGHEVVTVVVKKPSCKIMRIPFIYLRV